MGTSFSCPHFEERSKKLQYTDHINPLHPIGQNKQEVAGVSLAFNEVSFYPDRWHSIPRQVEQDHDVKIETSEDYIKVSVTPSEDVQILSKNSLIKRKLQEAGVPEELVSSALTKPSLVEIYYPKLKEEVVSKTIQEKCKHLQSVRYHHLEFSSFPDRGLIKGSFCPQDCTRGR